MNYSIRCISQALCFMVSLASSEAFAGTTLPEVTVSIDDASASEAGQDPATFTVTRTNAGNVAAALTVNYQFTGSAVLSADFTPDVFIFSGTVTIPGTALSISVNLTPILDNIIEGQETLNIELLPGATYTLGPTITGAMTFDDDVAEVTVSIDDASASEAGQDPATFTVTRTNAGNVAAALTVNYQFTGSAVLSADFTPDVFIFSGTVTIPGTALSISVNLTPILDNIIEGQETLNIELLPGATYTLGPTITGAMTFDDDVAEVTVSIDDASASEAGQDPATFTVTRTNAGNVAAALTVNYQFTGSAVLSADFTPDVFIFSGTVTIPGTALSISVNLTPILDNIIEGQETLNIELLPGATYTLGPTITGAMTFDDDVAEVTVSIDDASASEAGQDPATFTVTRTNAGNVAAALTVNYQFTGSAVLSADFTPDVFIFSGTVTIPGTALSISVNLTPIVDGSDNEDDETIDIELLAGANYALGAVTTGSMILFDARDFLYADSFESTEQKSCSIAQLAIEYPSRFFDQGVLVLDLDSSLVWHVCGLRASYDWLEAGCMKHAFPDQGRDEEVLPRFNSGLVGDNAGFTDWRQPNARDQATLPVGCSGQLVRKE